MLSHHQEKIINIKVSAEDLEQWADDLRDSGLSQDEVADIISRLSVSLSKREKPSAVRNITIPKEDVQEWITALYEGGFSIEEIGGILNRTNLSADKKAEINGTLRKIHVQDSEQGGEEVPVRVR